MLNKSDITKQLFQFNEAIDRLSDLSRSARMLGMESLAVDLWEIADLISEATSGIQDAIEQNNQEEMARLRQETRLAMAAQLSLAKQVAGIAKSEDGGLDRIESAIKVTSQIFGLDISEFEADLNLLEE